MINKIVLPSEVLSEYVEYYWIFEDLENTSDEVQFVYPEGKPAIFIHYQTPFAELENDFTKNYQPHFYFSGFSTKSKYVSANKEIGMIAVYFKPFGASFLLNLPFNESIDTKIDLSHDNKYIVEQLFECDSVKSKLEIIELYLLSKINTKYSYQINQLNHTYNFIKNNPTLSKVDLIASETCVSTRTLERIFQKRIGISPKLYLKNYRINYAIKLINSKTIDDNLSDIAIDAGFYDIAHFSKEFKQIIGITPTEFMNYKG